ncbi:uncharacterized protein LOC134535568 [Bacillus rossius redtenbacheri]|uniref:uncharacterized protein LOC134535568 n=1 Tax=Bacillus rossius redtenbacheri TaxID=93214 RepID=UPI002FDE9190
MRMLHIVLVLLQLGSSRQHRPLPEGAVGVVAGAHFEPIPQVTLYTSSVPVNFKVAWPMQLDDIQDSIKEITSCPSNSSSEWCVIFKELKHSLIYTDMLINKVNEAAGDDVLDFQSQVRERRGLNFIGEFFHWCCDIAVNSQLNNLFLNEQQMSEHINKMESQILNTHEALANMSNTIFVINEGMTGILKRVQSKFTNLSDYLKDLRETMVTKFSGMVQDIGHSFQFQVLLASQLAKQAHTFTRLEILDQCRSNKIPAIVVTPAQLKEKLNMLNEILNRDGYALSISVSEVQKYFNLPICKCQVHKENLYLQIKVPIVKLNSNWRLFQFVAVPFQWKNSTCHLDHAPNFLAVDGDHLITIQGRNLLDCRPFEDKLCFVPRFSGDTLGSALCPKALFQGITVENLSTTCAFRCHSGNQLMITQAGPERYFLTNPSGKLDLQCMKHNNESLFLGSGDILGAVDIEVPCDCRLYLNQELKINELYPCDALTKSKFQLVHVIPAAWTKLRKLKIFPHPTSTHTVFPSLMDCLDENWPTLIPHLNFSLTKFETPLDPIHLREPENVPRFVMKNLQSIALSIVSSVLLFIIIKNPYLVGIGTLPRVSALDNVTTLGIEISVTVITILVIVGMFLVLLLKYLRNRKPLSMSVEISTTVENAVPSTSGKVELKDILARDNGCVAKISSETGEELKVTISICDDQ